MTNDNKTIAVNVKDLLDFIEAFDEFGYGASSDMSVPAEWDGLIRKARECAQIEKEQTDDK